MQKIIEKLNHDIEVHFPHLHKVEKDFKTTFDGISRMVMLDRYSQKDIQHTTLDVGDIVITIVKDDPTFPVRGIGIVKELTTTHATVELEEDYRGTLEGKEAETGVITRHLSTVDKPLELFFEQIAKRVGYGLADNEEFGEKFFKELRELNLIPAGRVLHGAGSNSDVTFFNCFSGDTKIHTDEGAFAFKDIVGTTVNALSIDGIYRPAEIKSFGQQELYTITLANGEIIEATAEHEWLISDDSRGYTHTKPRVFTKDLKGKYIYQETTKPLKRDETLVRLGIQHGIVYGDGSINTHNPSTARVLLFDGKKALSKYFVGDGYQIKEHYNGDYLRVDKLPAYFKNLPIKEDSPDYWYGFIVGLLATDGHVDSRGAVRIFSSNIDDLEIIQHHLSYAGFIAGKIAMTRERSPFTGEYAPNYGLTIKKHSISKEDILNPLHLKNYGEDQDSSRRPSIQVIDVQPTGRVEEVYCGVEDETHTLVVGSGVLTGNCYVQPMIPDSRGGLSDHRKEVMEIMSRGGGVGTNGSSLRPRGAIAKSVGGKSSGSVSWLNDLANLTHLVEQGGSRRGAQMIMMADWHPDIIEFIVSKMQNPRILRWLATNSKDPLIKEEANAKLKFTPLSQDEIDMYEAIINSNTKDSVKDTAKKALAEGGKYEVQDIEFLTGANISVAITEDFMQAAVNNTDYELRYPDLDSLTTEQKDFYDKEWHNIGDVREWEALGYPSKVYYTIKAKELWDLIAFAATYSAEPGIFFIDNANADTNAKSYGQKVVATNPCKH